MNKNAGWVVVVVLLSIALILALVMGQTGLLQPATSDTPVAVFTPAPTFTPKPTATPDPCARENIVTEIARVHSLTREFEDTAQLLTSTLLRDSSIPLVQDLQRIRRAAEDQTVPPCLNDLKKYQIEHMNARINVFGTALAFLNQYGPNGDQNALNQLLEPFYAKAEQSAKQYESEYVRLQGKPTVTPTP